MSRIDPVSLRLFLVVAREGSIKRAAEAEHIAQSALSRRIADFERSLGVALFTRSPMGVVLTEAGERAHVLGQRLYDDIESFVREVQASCSQLGGTVRLFADHSSIVGFLPEKLQAFRSACPDVRIALQERSTAEILRACLDDRADVGVGVAVDDVPRGVEAWPFAVDPLIVVLPYGHALAKLRQVRFADVLRYPLVGINGDDALDVLLHEKAENLHASMQQVVSVSSFDAACRMVEAGLGISVMTASAVSVYAGTKGFVRRPLDEPWKHRQLCVYALRKSPRLRAVDALLDALRS
jgi:DNA-binding transcriptional LysR family regulator